MELPASLTARVYLLAYNTEKGKLTGKGHLGYVLRAAALTELYQAGAVTDAAGKVKPARAHLTDPLLLNLLEEITAESKPRSWARLVGRRARPMFRAVQQRLVEERLIGTEPYRILGIFPATKVKVHHHRVVTQLRSLVSRTLGGGSAEPKDAALAALAAVGEIRVAISRAQARERKQRIKTLVEQAGPALPALKKAIENYRAGYSATGG